MKEKRGKKRKEKKERKARGKDKSEWKLKWGENGNQKIEKQSKNK